MVEVKGEVEWWGVTLEDEGERNGGAWKSEGDGDQGICEGESLRVISTCMLGVTPVAWKKQKKMRPKDTQP
jgi:hypothetical protein